MISPKRFLIGWLAFSLCPAFVSAQEIVTRVIKIPDGTLVPMQLLDDLSSKRNKPDDPVRFKVREEVRVDGKVVIPFGALGVGKVAMVAGRGMAGKSGSVNFTVDYVKAADGTNVRVRGSPKVSGGGNRSVAAAAAVVYSPAALLVMRGSHAEIRKGTRFAVYVDGEKEVAVKTYDYAATTPATQEPGEPVTGAPPPAQSVATPPASTQPAAQPEPAETTSPDELSTVVMKSEPPGCDISIDGKFVGSTPSTVQLSPGEHRITIEKDGFKAWQRVLTVAPAGIVTIDAELEKIE